jgi:hypothetical protein
MDTSPGSSYPNKESGFYIRAPLKTYFLATLVITLGQVSNIQFLILARAEQAFLTCFMTS